MERGNKNTSNSNGLARKPWYKSWWGITLIIFATLVVLGFLSNASDKARQASIRTKSVASETFRKITSTETIPFQSETQKDPNKIEGDRVVTQAGVAGVREVVYKKFSDGSREIIRQKVLVEPINEIVTVGTKPKAKADAEAQYNQALALINQGDWIGADAALQNAIKLYDLPEAKQKKAEIQPNVAAAQEEQFKKQCTTIPYNQLEKDANRLVGTKVYYYGEVFNIEESLGKTTMQVFVTNKGWDIWDDQIMVKYDGRLDAYKDDKIHFWGEVKGTTSYESVAGWNISVPEVKAKYVSK